MQNVDGNLEDFLANVSLLSDTDKTADVNEAVTMMTVHSAKGLEFPVVFLVGMEEGLFPIARAIDSESELEEERRLCYVAITRAEEQLFISYANMRTIYGSTTYSVPSRFLKEIPLEYVETNDKNKEMTKKDVIVKEFTRRDTKAPDLKDNKDEVKVGSKVRHKLWGVGTVVQLKDKGMDTEVVVAFEDKGLKKLLLSIAPIEVI